MPQSSWDETKHPREPGGSKTGGRFTFADYRATSSARAAAGLDPLVIGYAYGKKVKVKGTKYASQINQYGLAQDTGSMADQEAMTNSMDLLEKYQQQKLSTGIEDYDSLDHTKSYALEPNAGFPEGHPLADPVARVREVAQANADLSYSNMVGYGGALKEASMGLKDTNLMKYGQHRWLLPGVTYDDMLTAMQKETEGLLKSKGITKLVLWHGTSSPFGLSNNKNGYVPFSLADFYKGISSWSSDQLTASRFGQYVVRAIVPASSILSVPGLMPKTIFGMGAGFTSMFGGDRLESEYIVRVK